MHTLVPCPNCSRHVRVTDGACPFCAAALNTNHLRRRHAARFRVLQQLPAGLSRATLYAVGTALFAQTACDAPSPPAPEVDPTAAAVATMTNTAETAPGSAAPSTAPFTGAAPSVSTSAAAETATTDVPGSAALTAPISSATTASTPLVNKPREYPRNRYNSVAVYGGPPRPRPNASKK